MAEAIVANYPEMKFTLNNGVKMPAIGFGTYQIRSEDEVFKVLDYALDAGYRMFDTAAVYSNEAHLKKAFKVLLPKYGLIREDIFVITKLSPADHGGKGITDKALMKSLENLGLEYVDLYLVHFPGCSRMNASDPKNKKMRSDTWAMLEQLYENGKANAIGVSNFTVTHLRDLLSTNHNVIPAVNQVEWHPYYHQEELKRFCKENDILLQAYSSFGGTSKGNPVLLNDPVVNKIAKKLNVTCAQLLLVWTLQQDIAVIPKSTNPERIKENISLNFIIPEEYMKALDALGKNNHKFAWDPSHVA